MALINVYTIYTYNFMKTFHEFFVYVMVNKTKPLVLPLSADLSYTLLGPQSYKDLALTVELRKFFTLYFTYGTRAPFHITYIS